MSTGKEVKEGGATNIQKFSAGAVDLLEIKKEEQENRDDMQIKKNRSKRGKTTEAEELGITKSGKRVKKDGAGNGN